MFPPASEVINDCEIEIESALTAAGVLLSFVLICIWLIESEIALFFVFRVILSFCAFLKSRLGF